MGVKCSLQCLKMVSSCSVEMLDLGASVRRSTREQDITGAASCLGIYSLPCPAPFPLTQLLSSSQPLSPSLSTVRFSLQAVCFFQFFLFFVFLFPLSPSHSVVGNPDLKLTIERHWGNCKATAGYVHEDIPIVDWHVGPRCGGRRAPNVGSNTPDRPGWPGRMKDGGRTPISWASSVH